MHQECLLLEHSVWTITPERKSSPGRQHVILVIIECLEMVLRELDPTTLLVSAQRVCKIWRDTIISSPALQRKLFFAPSDGRAAKTQTRIRIPLLVNAFPAFFQTTLQQRVPYRSFFEDLDSAGGGQDAPFLRKGASWRRMYPEYPVTFKIGVIESRGPDPGSFFGGVEDVPKGSQQGSCSMCYIR
ncbi:uncharacterized protein DNG_04688 [Cephalotrichum gorgonifer]|uniref:F-box domain-containing protein n=1 Tax=Cephalotrichum gorgonifer TaxID=2041049 RepID=A0AAE8MX49_9PEZI|nr:uncharacterized protein DNG_04688 [Cephalotrichum gorgonifer]